MTEAEERRRTGLTRKELLGDRRRRRGRGAAGAGRAGSSGRSPRASARRRDVAGMNVILFLTDQERAIQHFPPNWLRQNLPGMRRLRRHGLSFERAFTNACMCSPARSTLMSGYFPAQHGVKYTLEEDMPASEYPQVELPTDLAEPGHGDAGGRLQRRLQGQVALLEAGGRGDAVPADLESTASPLEPAGRRRQPDVPEAGGGNVDNDGRFMNSVGSAGAAPRARCSTSSSTAAQQQPFFMVISLVNPHDVLFYPSTTFDEAGYDESWLRATSSLPATIDEDLSTKPTVQAQFLRIFNLTGKPKTRAEAQLPQLLRQPDALLRRLPGQRPRQARRDRPASTTR